jgi:hypothetical protein
MSGGIIKIKSRLNPNHTSLARGQDRKAKHEIIAINGNVSAGAGTQPGTTTSRRSVTVLSR